MKRLAALSIFLLIATQVKAKQWMEADQWTVGWLGNVCSSFEIEDKLICGAYLQGFFAGQQAEAMTSKRPEPRSIVSFCRPPTLTVEQIAELVSEFALEHPNAAYENAHFALADHFEKIWPCKE